MRLPLCSPAAVLITGLFLVAPHSVKAQTAGKPGIWDAYFQHEVAKAAAQTQTDLEQVTLDNWPTLQSAWRSELRSMLGLEPLPARTDLQTTVTGTIHHTGLTIHRLHYQSRPGLYVAANLYLPQGAAPEKGWPAVLYVCGHAKVDSYGRLLGNKTGYHHHGLWFARHGTACLIIDTVQLGELHGEHHGTYKLGRWDWITRGYTPAGVEAWNAIRGVDLLSDWPGIDGRRIGITGRSGGGAYSWFAAALDDRIQVAVPVAGITDLENHIIDDCVEGHCDCMYFVNYFGWDYGKLAALIAPRPLLLANSDNDRIFPLDGVLRIHNQLSGLYTRLKASDKLGVLITPGPHQDTQELQVGAFKWLLKNLHGQDPVIDIPATKELTPDQLAVFAHEAPRDERVAAVGNWFVDSPTAAASTTEAVEKWNKVWLHNLKPTALRLPLRELANAPKLIVQATGKSAGRKWHLLQSERQHGLHTSVLLIEGNADRGTTWLHIDRSPSLDWNPSASSIEQWISNEAVQNQLTAEPDGTHCFVQARGGDWQPQLSSLRERTHTVRRFYLLGQTPEQLLLADILCCLKSLRTLTIEGIPTTGNYVLIGAGRVAPVSVLAALLCQSQVDPLLPPVNLQISNYPTDVEVAACFPGLLREVTYDDLLATARESLVTKEPVGSLRNPQRLVDSADEPQQATGMRIIEVNSDRASVWVRATRWSLPNLADMPSLNFRQPAERGTHNQGAILPALGVDGLQYAVPGVPAEVRVGTKSAQDREWKYSAWQAVEASTDFSAIVNVTGLNSDCVYEVRTQVKASGADRPINSLAGSFKTLPAADVSSPFRLAVGTCQDFPDRDGPHGFDLYRTLLVRKTQAFVLAGDVVYYDKLARSVPLAHYHWQQTYGLPTLVNFHRQVPTYFLKDDHDTYVNDTWPGTQFSWTEDFTFEDGQRIFRQQTGLPSPAYRTIHFGKDLQVWLMEGRDYRSPNDAPDGPEKSIWGEEQKAWLKRTLDESKAKFRLIISPTPIVGPDRKNKRDNHSNAVFSNEGQAVRKMLASYPNLVSVCGDRHWQYHSIDPETGLHEFSVGPASDRHAGGWDPKEFHAGVHQFLRVAGGYLEIELGGTATEPTLTLRHLDTLGNEQHVHRLK